MLMSPYFSVVYRGVKGDKAIAKKAKAGRGNLSQKEFNMSGKYLDDINDAKRSHNSHNLVGFQQ